jgi:hypothetical protein
MSAHTDPDVFISYARHDGERLGTIARELEAAGVSLWRDRQRILGGEVYGPVIMTDEVRQQNGAQWPLFHESLSGIG